MQLSLAARAREVYRVDRRVVPHPPLVELSPVRHAPRMSLPVERRLADVDPATAHQQQRSVKHKGEASQRADPPELVRARLAQRDAPLRAERRERVLAVEREAVDVERAVVYGDARGRTLRAPLAGVQRRGGVRERGVDRGLEDRVRVVGKLGRVGECAGHEEHDAVCARRAHGYGGVVPANVAHYKQGVS